MTSSATAELWDAIARGAAGESAIWGDALKDPAARSHEPVFSPLSESRYALGLETIYEGYLVHYAEPRLFAPPDGDTALLLGDYLYAHGLVRVAELEEVDAVSDLSELISLCSQLRAENGPGDGPLWAATAALLGSGGELGAARSVLRLHGDPSALEAAARAASSNEAVDTALRLHARRFGDLTVDPVR